ncbi:MAG: hypothetical protein O3A00_06285 [Planctomycetota bacterium]|nr:hypothetical protein [Planctomycetota bacterium]
MTKFEFVTFRGRAYVFQIWRALDFGFTMIVCPPNLKVVSLTPCPQIPRLLKAVQFATFGFRAMWLIRRSYAKRASRELGGQAYEFQIWRFVVVGEFRAKRQPNLKYVNLTPFLIADAEFSLDGLA